MPRIVAHRGRLGVSMPENALSSIAAAVAAGVDSIELDLRASRQGTLYVLHDETLERCSNGHGPIAEASDEYLQTLRLDDGTSPLLSFEQFLSWLLTQETLTVILDLKSVKPTSAVAALTRFGLASRCILLTFTLAQARAALAFEHEARVSVHVTESQVLEAYHDQAGRLAFYLPQDADPALFAAAARFGAPIITDAMMPLPSGSLDQRALVEGDAPYRAFCTSRAPDFLVTDRPLEAMSALAQVTP